MSGTAGCLESEVRSHPIASGTKASSWDTDRKPSLSSSKRSLLRSAILKPNQPGWHCVKTSRVCCDHKPHPCTVNYVLWFDTIYFLCIIHSNLLTGDDQKICSWAHILPQLRESVHQTRPSGGDSGLSTSVRVYNVKDPACFINGKGRCGFTVEHGFHGEEARGMGVVTVDGATWNA